ncbi:hypothetical protein TNCV_3608891 [Trichonephila clavipes]|nr:hypothetical protein TNCV_3608891 [Trichonephila clavipes]
MYIYYGKSNPLNTGFSSNISQGAKETSRNITARVIERDTRGEIYYILEDSRGFRTRQRRENSHQSRHVGFQLGLQNDANLALPPRFHQVLIESPL